MSGPQRRSATWWVLRILRGAAFIYVVFAAAMFLLQRFLIFPSWVIPRGAAPPLPAGAEVWTREIEHGEHVEAFVIFGKGVSAQTPGPAVLFFHGNGELIDYWVDAFRLYTERGITVMMSEYRSYGRSGGSPSEQALADDAIYFEQRLVNDPRVDKNRIVIHGRSIGGGIACAVAARIHPVALILQSTFSRMADMAARRGLPGLLARDPLDNMAVVKQLEVPTFIVHGRNDPLIPIELGRRLAAQRPGIRFEELDCKHNDCPPDWAGYMNEVLHFLEDAGVMPRSVPAAAGAPSAQTPVP
jgi:pimeloyl-ACP methyl ester carboxylesterase